MDQQQTPFDVKVTPYNGTNMDAFASVHIHAGIVDFWITGMKIMRGKNGRFLSMPSRKDNKTNEWKDVAYPGSKEFRDQLSHSIFNEYDRIMSSQSGNPGGQQGGAYGQGGGGQGGGYSGGGYGNQGGPGQGGPVVPPQQQDNGRTRF